MRSRTLLLALLLTSIGAPVALAQQGPTASETALAREQYQDGMHFAESGHWEQAYQAFSRAYALVHRPALLANLASAEAQTGRLVEAAEHDRQFLREVTTGREAAQRPSVQAALDALDARIPRARFVSDGSQPSDVYLLDGQPLPAAVIGTPYPIDPGDHVLLVKAGETEIGRAAFTVHESESRDVPVSVHRPAPVVDTHVHVGDGHEGPGPDVHHDDLVGPPPPPVVHDDGGVLASPVFWIVVGVVVAGGATTAIVLATQGGREPFGGGNLGTVVIP